MAEGAQLVSLNPLRDTLEDFFVRQVSRRRPHGARNWRACMRTVRLDRRERVQGVGARQGALQPGRLRGAPDLDVVPARPADGRAGLKIIKDLGLASISIFGLLIAVFIGIGLVWKEVEKRSIYALLSKPMRRGEFVLGKYCGLVLTLAINVA